MDSLLQTEEEESSGAKLARQAFAYVGHILLALASWAGLMALGYALNPVEAPPMAILGLSVLAPLLVGFVAMKIHPSEMATAVWLMGLIWLLIVALWILDMPTGPNECFQCGATEKLTRTFFSLPSPSGLIDNDGPFLGTWPAAALVGYAIGARLGMRRAK